MEKHEHWYSKYDTKICTPLYSAEFLLHGKYGLFLTHKSNMTKDCKAIIIFQYAIGQKMNSRETNADSIKQYKQYCFHFVISSTQ